MTRIVSSAQDLVWLAPGIAVERDALNIVEWIRKYDPNLDVLCLNPERCDSVFDAPYLIVEKCKDGNTRLVFSAWTLDERIKEKIIAADTYRSPVIENLNATNEAARKAQREKWADSKGEASDIGKYLLKNPKTSYTIENHQGELVKIEDDFGVVKRDGHNEHD